MEFRAQTIEIREDGTANTYNFYTLYAARLHQRRRAEVGVEIEVRDLVMEGYEQE